MILMPPISSTSLALAEFRSEPSFHEHPREGTGRPNIYCVAMMGFEPTAFDFLRINGLPVAYTAILRPSYRGRTGALRASTGRSCLLS